MSQRICVFGSSIARGRWNRDRGSWTHRLLKNFESDTKNKKSVYSLCVSGDTTVRLLRRFKVECAARRPDVIVLEIGSNDSSYRESIGRKFVSLSKFEENLRTLLQEAREFTDKIVFVGLTTVDESKTRPVSWNKEVFYKSKDIEEYNSVIEKFCRDNNVCFIDVLGLLDNNEDLYDGLHPNEKGHEKLFRAVKDFLVENRFINITGKRS